MAKIGQISHRLPHIQPTTLADKIDIQLLHRTAT